jgi:hypothetical protein
VNELATQQQAPAAGFSLAPRSLDEAFRLADMLAQSDMVPKDFQRKPGNVMIAMQWGMEVGLKPLQALQNIAVINGRPSMWGDAVLALVRSSPLCEYVREHEEPVGTAVCRVKRRGDEEQVRTFSIEDAKTAGLHGKSGPWTSSPKRMRQMRARSFALRDVFADVLKGMDIAEAVMDHTDIPQEVSRPTAAAEVVNTEPQVYPEDKFAQALPIWRGLIADKKKTADQIIATVQTKHTLSAEQVEAIRKPIEPPKVDDDGVIDADFVAGMERGEAQQKGADDAG